MKKIGWFCSYTPVEIIDASGAYPVGIKKDSGAAHEDTLLGDSICSYVRSCMGGALTGVYDELDGVVVSHSCECMRRLGDGWKYRQDQIAPKLVHILDIPKIVSDPSIKFFANGLRLFAEDLGEFSSPVTDENLWASIKKYKKTRILFSELNEMRKDKKTAVTGSEVETLIYKSFEMPREEFNLALEKFIKEKRGKETDGDSPRVMIVGGPGNKSLIPSIEKAGAVSVLENMCSGLRAYSGDFKDYDDPYMQLADLYLNKTPCPRMLGEKSKSGLSELEDFISDYSIDGILFYSMKFCANMQLQWAMLKNEMEISVPLKVLEGDISDEINEREIHSFVKRLKKRKKKNEQRRNN